MRVVVRGAVREVVPRFVWGVVPRFVRGVEIRVVLLAAKKRLPLPLLVDDVIEGCVVPARFEVERDVTVGDVTVEVVPVASAEGVGKVVNLAPPSKPELRER